MSKIKITELVPELLEPFFRENPYELFNIEYVKEGKDWFLRLYIDKAEVAGEPLENIGVEDCEKVSRFISDKLDELDPIERNYYLEVSSPGLDRPLLRDSDFLKYKGRMVDIFLYKPIDGQKIITGELENLKNNIISLMIDNKNKIEISRDKVAKTKLTVIF